jgi:hypothetical protein
MAVVRSGSISPRLLTKAAVAESSAVVRPPQIYTRRIRLQSGKSTPPTWSGRGWPAGFISRNAYAVPTTCDRPIAVTNCVFAIAITLANHGWLTPAALDCKPDAVAEVCFPPVQRLRSPRLAHASRSWCTVFVRCQSAICDGQTHIHRSGGRQPAVARKRIGGHERFFANRNARPPRLAHASRSWCTVFVRCQSAICDGQTHIHRSGGR